MRYFLFFLIPIFVFAKVYSVDEYKRSFYNLSLKQQRILYEIYQGAAKYNMSWTCAAIAWQESYAGEIRIKPDDGKHGSCGVMHNLLDSVFSRHPEWVKTKNNYNRICTQLMLNNSFSLMEAIDEINYWKKRRKKWIDIWASYNGGWKYKSKKAQDYAKNIRNRIKAMFLIIGHEWDQGFMEFRDGRRIKK